MVRLWLTESDLAGLSLLTNKAQNWPSTDFLDTETFFYARQSFVAKRWERRETNFLEKTTNRSNVTFVLYFESGSAPSEDDQP